MGCMIVEYLQQLNEQQRQAATTTEGYIRVVAGAGSGKTGTLTARYLYLVEALGISTAIGTMISMALTPLLIKKFDERKVFVAMSVYGFVASIAAFFAGTATNFHLGALIPTLFLVGLQFGAVNIMPMVMVADSVDYYEYKTGRRTEGVAYAVLSFSVKVTLALGSAVCLATVFSDLVGYSATAAEYTFETKRGVYFAYTIIPGITSILAAVPILFYDLVGAKKRRVSEALAALRAGSESETAESEIAEPNDANA